MIFANLQSTDLQTRCHRNEAEGASVGWEPKAVDLSDCHTFGPAFLHPPRLTEGVFCDRCQFGMHCSCPQGATSRGGDQHTRWRSCSLQLWAQSLCSCEQLDFMCLCPCVPARAGGTFVVWTWPTALHWPLGLWQLPNCLSWPVFGALEASPLKSRSHTGVRERWVNSVSLQLSVWQNRDI